MVLKSLFPRPDFERKEWLNLNGSWDFSFAPGAYDEKIEVPYPWGSPLSGVSGNDRTEGHYRKNVSWDPENERIFLIFGAVDYECSVTVNGTEVVCHKGGYDEFEADVTEVWFREKENEILVDVKDEGAKNQTYGKQGYGDARGIWQTVRMEGRPASFIKGFFVKTKLSGEVIYEIETCNAKDGEKISARFGDYYSESFIEDNKALLELFVSEPALWTPEEPNLYEGFLSLGADRVYTYFGIREIGTGVFGEHKNRYITLNGKPYFINGTLDQSFNPKGFFTLPGDADCREEILRLKRIGVNMARIHIKAEEPLKLYYADKLGLLIMEDIPCFWGEPLPETRAQYEKEMEAEIVRDRNHPAIFYWVVFNETWGLFTGEGENRKYTEETAKWVVDCWKKTKTLDPTRLVEDNSVCNRDHTLTDVNTWHFYRNGYEVVKKEIDSFCENAYPGTQANYKEGYTMQDVPCMNSECGAVWGVEGNAGESDISWQYKYMINEFRRHDKLCGFIFTEFHDVVNEFNGYYKLNNEDKDFGYGDFGMSLKDLHSQDYLGADFAPMTTVKPGELLEIPMFSSSFSDEFHQKTLTVSWELTGRDPLLSGEVYVFDSGSYDILWPGYGTGDGGVIRFEVPEFDGPCMLSWNLLYEGGIIMRNCLFIDVDSPVPEVFLVEPSAFTGEGFDVMKDVQEGNKKIGLGNGAFCTTVRTADIPYLPETDELHLIFEAATREPMRHDFPDESTEDGKIDMNYMLGYRIDPGENRNSFKQTDEYLYSGDVEVYIDGEKAGAFLLPDDPADSRGLLSNHYQAVHNLLDEAGTYGYLCDLTVPSRILFKLKEKESFTLELRTASGHGLSLFGRKSGRYGIGVVFMA